jgi:hypothetical protein
VTCGSVSSQCLSDLQPRVTGRLCVSSCCLQLRLMCQFGNAVTVEVLPPYIPSQAEKDDPALYAANIRKLIVSGVQSRVLTSRFRCLHTVLQPADALQLN